MSLKNIQNTNLENGISNRNASHLFGSMSQLDPIKWHTYWEDFDYFIATNFEVDISTGSADIEGGDGGFLLMQTTAAADNFAALQKHGATFVFEAGKPLYFATAFATDEANQTTILIGLYDTTGDPVGSPPANGVFFESVDGNNTMNLVHVESTTITSENITTLTDDVTVKLAYVYDGIDRIYYSVDDNTLGYLDLSGTTVITAGTRISMVIQTGNSAVDSLSIDYIFAAKER